MSRQLLVNPEFRTLITSRPATPGATGPAVAPAAAVTLVATKPKPAAEQGVGLRRPLIVANDEHFGSGFIVSDDGYVITNHHVVGAAQYVKLKWPDGKDTLGEVIRSDPHPRRGADPKADVAGRPALGLRTSPPKQGETVFAIGSPFGATYQNTMSKGIVSALRTQGGRSFIQSDVMVNHGSSGGPLLDETGLVMEPEPARAAAAKATPSHGAQHVHSHRRGPARPGGDAGPAAARRATGRARGERQAHPKAALGSILAAPPP